MKKDTRVLLTEKWWTDNKDMTLSDKAGLGKALKTFEDCYKLAGVAKGSEKVRRINAAKAALVAVNDAAAKTAKNATRLLHGDTIHVLTKTFPPKAKEHEDTLDKLMATLKKEFSSLTAVEVMKDRTLRVAFLQYAAKRHISENPNFVLAASQKDAGVYNEFIRAGAPQEINISAALRGKFDEAMQNNALGAAPWKEALGVVIGLMQSNDMALFGKHLLENS